MAKLTSKTTTLLVIVIFAMISSLPKEAESSKLTISWPKWFWCFPECVFGKTCFMKVHEYCRDQLPHVSVLNCILVALEWCDIEFFDLNQMVFPSPPHSANSFNGTNVKALKEEVDLE